MSNRAMDWYGHRGVQIRTFWQIAISVIVLVAAIQVNYARDDVNDLLARQKQQDAQKAVERQKGVAAREQQCAVTPIFFKALSLERLSVHEVRVLNAALAKGLKGCPK